MSSLHLRRRPPLLILYASSPRTSISSRLLHRCRCLHRTSIALFVLRWHFRLIQITFYLFLSFIASALSTTKIDSAQRLGFSDKSGLPNIDVEGSKMFNIVSPSEEEVRTVKESFYQSMDTYNEIIQVYRNFVRDSMLYMNSPQYI